MWTGELVVCSEVLGEDSPTSEALTPTGNCLSGPRVAGTGALMDSVFFVFKFLLCLLTPSR